MTLRIPPRTEQSERPEGQAQVSTAVSQPPIYGLPRQPPSHDDAGPLVGEDIARNERRAGSVGEREIRALDVRQDAIQRAARMAGSEAQPREVDKSSGAGMRCLDHAQYGSRVQRKSHKKCGAFAD